MICSLRDVTSQVDYFTHSQQKESQQQQVQDWTALSDFSPLFFLIFYVYSATR